MAQTGPESNPAGGRSLDQLAPHLRIGMLRRARRPRHWRGYSHLVALLKWVLPLIAAGLIVTIAIWPQLQGRDGEFRLGPARITYDEALTVRVVNPRYTGVDRSDRPYMVTASDAQKDATDGNMITMVSPKADVTLEDGSWVALTAEAGTYFKDIEILDLNGDVNLFHDQGYEFHSNSAQLDFANGEASGDDAIAGQSPQGTVQARGFRLLDKGDRIVFKGPATLVIYPKASDIETPAMPAEVAPAAGSATAQDQP
jgi:lipopolysaccharide export system protein LptC